MVNREIRVDSIEELTALFGSYDANADIIRKDYDVSLRVSGDTLTVSGEEENVDRACKLIASALEYMHRGNALSRTSLRILGDMLECGGDMEKLNEVVAVTARGKQIKCKTYGQFRYVDAIKRNSIVFGIGPAGTGKTYLAVALAVAAYKAREIDKIILTRPAVEAGEKLGFLPGDLGAKVDPYLRPLYDALQELFGVDTYAKLIEKNVIEIAPLAYMRGRTLSHAFIILDEAQNTTREQFKMFLTRMGEGSKIVITGDVTQIDLPRDKQSGLVHASRILRDIDGIDIVELTSKDVVRHDLVRRIVNAYAAAEEREEEERKARRERISENNEKKQTE